MKIRDRIKELRRVKASEILPNPKNWRTHPQAQQDALRGVLAEVGIADALLCRDTPAGLMLIDGHMRADTSPDTEWPVLILDVDEAEADKLLATFDPLADMAVADPAKLDALLREIDTGSEALQEMLAELAKDAGLYKTPEVNEDEVPEPPADPVTKPGDLWLLGEHRLLCGDSTDAATVDRLFAGGRASLLFTSPPYGQQRDYGKAKELVKDWDGLMQGVFQHADRVMEPDGQVLVNLGLIHRDGEWLPYWDGWIAWMRERGWRRFGWYVWDKGESAPGDTQGRLAPSHEFVFHFNRNAVRAAKTVPCKHAGLNAKATGMHEKDGSQTAFSAKVNSHKVRYSVVRAVPAKGIGGHPAPFPVALAAAFLESWPGLAFEPFSGSGTTIIAAEQLGRRCYGLELEPKYCDVALQRWAKLTGKTPTLEDGTPFPVEVAGQQTANE